MIDHSKCVVVLDWSSRPHHLIRTLRPDATIHRIIPGMSGDSVLRMLLSQERKPDAVLLHIDASQPISFIRDFRNLCISLGNLRCEVWNGAVEDIRKRTLQTIVADLGLPTTLATPYGPPDEIVIVKTNLNSRGISEWELSDIEREAVGLGHRKPSPLDGLTAYPVMARSEVPADWWNHPDLAIERYIDNRLGNFTRVYVAGDNYVVCTGRSAAPVRRMNHAVDRYDYFLDRATIADPRLDEFLPASAVAAALAALVITIAMGIDYGAIDLVEAEDGTPYVVDVNVTPYWGAGGQDQQMLKHLRAGMV